MNVFMRYLHCCEKITKKESQKENHHSVTSI